MGSQVDIFIGNAKLSSNCKSNTDAKGVFFVEQRTLPIQCLKGALLSAMVREHHNIQPISIYSTPIYSSFKIFEYFGIKKGIQLSLRRDYKNILASFILVSVSFFDVLSFILRGRNFADFIKKYKIKGIHVGDLIFDTYLRSGNRFISPEKHILALFIQILKAQYLTRKLLSSFDKYTPELVIVTTRAYASVGGIMSRIALKKSIPTWVSGATYRYKLYKYEKAFIGDYDYSIADINKNLPQDWHSIVDGYLQSRFNGNIEQHDVKFAFSSSSSENISALKAWKKSSGNLPIVVIFAHAFSDANNFDGDSLYTSYYEWLKQTLISLKKNKDYLVVVKPHPSAMLYNEEFNIYVELMKKIGCDTSFYLITEKVNTKAVLDIATTIITCRGTVSLEASALGIPCISAARPAFGDLPINYRACDIDNYRSLLKKCIRLKAPSNFQIDLAKKVIYKYLIVDKINVVRDGIETKIPNTVFPQKIILPNSNRDQIEQNFENYFSALNLSLEHKKIVNDPEYHLLKLFSQTL